MKQIFTLVLVAAAALAQAQNTTVISNTPSSANRAAQKISKTRTIDRTTLRAHNNPVTTQAVESAWINFAEAMDAFWGQGTYELNQNYLFPDSTVLGEFGTGTFSSVWIHNLGDVVDVTSDHIATAFNLDWNRANSYSVDSMAILYAYERNIPNPAIVDTLVVTLYHSGTTSNFTTAYFSGATAQNYGTDTLTVKIMKYSQATNKPNATNTTVVKVPLTDADTAMTFFREKAFETNFSVPSGQIFAASVAFKPGYTYSMGDTLETELNSFIFVSVEEQGAGSGGTFPLFTDCNWQPSGMSTSCDYNHSSIVPIDVRYNQAGSWNGYYIPSYAYTAPYGFEHHYFSYKVTSVNVGVEENTAAGFSLLQNNPNPFNGMTTIGYELAKNSDVLMQVFDITGKKVMDVKESGKAAGKHTMNLDCSNLEAGVYFYTFTANGSSLTKRMVITK